VKDIQNEVKALELAMQVATDIQDKPYAYSVARIQEALLGRSVAEAVPVGSSPPASLGDWVLSLSPHKVSPLLTITTPKGAIVNYSISPGTSGMCRGLVDAFNKKDYLQMASWHVFIPTIGYASLRYECVEIFLGLLPESSQQRAIILQLKDYLSDLRESLA